jgi:hypothetical protein
VTRLPCVGQCVSSKGREGQTTYETRNSCSDGAFVTWTRQNGYTGRLCTTAWYNGRATVGVSNLNTGGYNWDTVPVL